MVTWTLDLLILGPLPILDTKASHSRRPLLPKSFIIFPFSVPSGRHDRSTIGW